MQPSSVAQSLVTRPVIILILSLLTEFPALKALISRILGATHVGSSSDGYASRTGGNTKRTFGSRNDDLDSKGGGIRLQQDIEMKPYNKDDDNDSERNLIIMGNAESFVSGRRVGNQTTITGNTKL